jgi:hypothetical protein
MSLVAELERIATLVADAEGGEQVVAVLAAEPSQGRRTYICALESERAGRTWLAVDAAGVRITSRRDLRDAVAIAALCEIAAEAAGGGDLDDLLSRLVAVRIGEQPVGIEEAEAAVRALQHVIGVAPQLATPARLDDIGAATRRLELALDPTAGSPFAATLRASQDAIDELVREVEATYRASLEQPA